MSAERERQYTEQIVVRLSPEMRAAAEADAAANGRTLSQTIRWATQLYLLAMEVHEG